MTNEFSVRQIDAKIEYNIPSISSARLVYVKGNGAISVKSKTIALSPPYNGSYYVSHICLNDVPLVQINSSRCPTCQSLVATGFGIEKADCKQLLEIQDRINSPFVSIDKSIEDISPLLCLLKTGLYIIADGFCYPTDGDDNFFWNTSNKETLNPATAGTTIYGENTCYISNEPVYLYPTQNTDCYNPERAEHYILNYRDDNKNPRVISYNFASSLSFILDGHHKAAAAAKLKKAVQSLIIVPFTGYFQAEKILYFMGFSVKEEQIPKECISEPKFHFNKDDSIEILEGKIIKRKWEQEYVNSSNCYPNMNQYAYMVSSGLSAGWELDVSKINALIEIADDESLATLTAILYILSIRNDIRLKEIILLCISKIKRIHFLEPAYEILSTIKDDTEVEDIFIDYLVNFDASKGYDRIENIAHAYLGCPI